MLQTSSLDSLFLLLNSIDKSDEEEDLGSEPYKAPKKNQQPVKDNQESEEHKDLHGSWNTKSESKNVDDHASQKFKEFEKSRDHFKKTEGPVYQEVVKNLETPHRTSEG